MSTRCFTIFQEPDGKIIAIMYRHHDGYPKGHGRDLGEFLVRVGAREIGYTAAQVVAHFQQEGDYIELLPLDKRGWVVDYEYIVSGKHGSEAAAHIRLQRPHHDGTDPSLLFEGDASTFLERIEKGWPEQD